jgi:hypothetical protein
MNPEVETPRRPEAGNRRKNKMGRVHYTNETIQRIKRELHELEQTVGWNLRCADRGTCDDDEAIAALTQVIVHLPIIRAMLDEVQAEAMKAFLDRSPTGLKAGYLAYEAYRKADLSLPF